MTRSAKLLSAILALGLTIAPLAIAADAPPGTEGKASAHANASQRRALDRPLPEIKFNASALSDVLEFLADSTSSNISVDWKALEAAQIAKDAPITLRLSSKVSLRRVLSLVLRQVGEQPLTFFVDDGVIEITTQEASDKVMISKVYPIQDLLFQATDYNNAPDLSLQNAGQGQTGGGGGGGGGAQNQQSIFGNGGSSQSQQQTATSQTDRANEIIKLITDTVKPELWQVNGGTSTISFYRGNLIVNAPRSIHELLESH